MTEQKTEKTITKKSFKQILVELKQTISAFFASRTKYDYIRYIYYIVILLSFINIMIMTLHLWDKDYNYPILNRSYVNAIAPEQDVNQTMYTDIIKIREFKESKISVGDYIVVYGDYGVNEYWVEEVLSIDSQNQILEVTYDGVSAIDVDFDDTIGIYVKEANIFGTMYYTAKYPRGYTLMMIMHLIIVAAIYFESFDRRASR